MQRYERQKKVYELKKKGAILFRKLGKNNILCKMKDKAKAAISSALIK